MTLHSITPVNEEILFGQDEIIVSKTDLKGKLTYVNDVFCRVAEMSTQDVIDQPQSIIRHPDMPRAVFKLLWIPFRRGRNLCLCEEYVQDGEVLLGFCPCHPKL